MALSTQLRRDTPRSAEVKGQVPNHFTGLVPYTGTDHMRTTQRYRAFKRLRLSQVPLRADAAAPGILLCGLALWSRKQFSFHITASHGPESQVTQHCRANVADVSS